MDLGYFGFGDYKNEQGVSQDTLWDDIGQGVRSLDGKDWATLAGAGLGAYGKAEELSYNKELSAQNAAWNQKLLDVQLGAQADATAYRDSISDMYAGGFNMAKYGAKKPVDPFGLGTVPAGISTYTNQLG